MEQLVLILSCLDNIIHRINEISGKYLEDIFLQDIFMDKVIGSLSRGEEIGQLILVE